MKRINNMWFNTHGTQNMVTVTLAKDTDKEFELKLPFKTVREMKTSRKKFKQEVLGKTGNGPCWEFYLQYLPDTYSVDDIKPNKSRDKTYFIEKYGNAKGIKRWREKKKKDQTKGTLAGYIERYGETEGPIKYKEKNSRLSVSTDALAANGKTQDEIKKIQKRHAEKSANTLENYITRYGETEGPIKYEEMLDNIVSHWSLSYWINKGYDEDSAKKIISDLQTRDLVYFIDKYGDCEGKRRYVESTKKKVTRSGSSISKLEMEIFEDIVDDWSDAEPTKSIDKYVVDIYIPRMNTVVEVYGDYWHCNPQTWTADRYNKSLKMTAFEKWKKDTKRIKVIESLGYNVVVLWESDIKQAHPKQKEYIRESIINTIDF